MDNGGAEMHANWLQYTGTPEVHCRGFAIIRRHCCFRWQSLPPKQVKMPYHKKGTHLQKTRSLCFPPGELALQLLKLSLEDGHFALHPITNSDEGYEDKNYDSPGSRKSID
jgi:hypothetical protein